MNIKSLLLGSAAALVAVTGARAADAVVVAEPEPVEYVKVCDAYGAGFYYIPGTDTCLKISGYVRADVKGGDLWEFHPITAVDEDGEPTDFGDTYDFHTRATLRFDARSETELGTLKSYIEARLDYQNSVQSQTLAHGYIELGGFRVGVTDSRFDAWTGGGPVIEDGIVPYAGGRTNQISYTFAAGNGFSAIISLEQGDSSHLIVDYAPHVVAGAKFEQEWGSISAVGGYDSVVEEFAGKLRADVKFNDTISAFIMAGYQSDPDKPNYYGAWLGDWAVWGGGSAKVAENATVNGQVSYSDAGALAASLNVDYEIVPGFVITPEIDYLKVDADDGDDDAFGGIVRFQRNF
ncbi:porin [Phyllobacterium brassicacearum]|uniref:Porin n=1 Tax=Phyllobacterium brassicacearum TaxID=314235 RepID=A0A2P7BN89_9HYPH|nr:porin [Phyllobacterium brassicacearum]PSH67933.1 porin [Phyllobacterium brassicacearum]TDQ28183.1 porin-like protein [Phyllobacterium brassicacearum]